MADHPLTQYAFADFVNNIKDAQSIAQNRHKWQVWGWYTVLDSIAEGGRFKTSDLSAMEGAMSSNFWEAMIWVAKQKHLSSSINLREK